jgi:hypothetical protein
MSESVAASGATRRWTHWCPFQNAGSPSTKPMGTGVCNKDRRCVDSSHDPTLLASSKSYGCRCSLVTVSAQGRQFDRTEVQGIYLYMGKSCDDSVGSVMAFLFCHNLCPRHRTGWPSIDCFSPADTRVSLVCIHKANPLHTGARKRLS